MMQLAIPLEKSDRAHDSSVNGRSDNHRGQFDQTRAVRFEATGTLRSRALPGGCVRLTQGAGA